MSKAPADQFYFSDFLTDTAELSLAATGAWIKSLCKMWFSVTRGRISMPLSGYARLYGCTVDQAKVVIDEIAALGVGDAETDANGNITLTNRRMYRKATDLEANKIRQFRFQAKKKIEQGDEYNGQANDDLTSYSSSSTSNNTNTLRAGEFDFPLKELIEAFPDLNITPAQVGLIEADVKPPDREAWLSTIRLYQANYNRSTRTYLPEKVGNLLGVFESEKRRLAKNGSTQKHSGKRTDADVLRESADFYDQYPA